MSLRGGWSAATILGILYVFDQGNFIFFMREMKTDICDNLYCCNVGSGVSSASSVNC